MEPQMIAADSLSSRVANYMEASENLEKRKRREKEGFRASSGVTQCL